MYASVWPQLYIILKYIISVVSTLLKCMLNCTVFTRSHGTFKTLIVNNTIILYSSDSCYWAVTDPRRCVGCWARSPCCWSGIWADIPPAAGYTPRSCSLRRSRRTAPRRCSTPARAPAPPRRCAETRTGGSYRREPFLRRGLRSTCLCGITEELCKQSIRDRATVRLTTGFKVGVVSLSGNVLYWSGALGLNITLAVLTLHCVFSI